MISGTSRRVIRIFISSVFGEFEEERDILAKTVFKELQQQCERNGFVFHPIDLRWGVSSADAAENITMKLCFDEIDRCKEYSPAINFFIMVGEDYGWQPLPETIDEPVWKLLTARHANEDRRVKLLNQCYWQDKNDLRTPYHLRLPSHGDPSVNSVIDAEQVRAALNELLDEIEELNYGSDDAQCTYAANGELDTLRWQLGASATEQEIMRGFFKEEYKQSSFNSKFNTFIMLKESDRTHAEEFVPRADPASRLRDRLRREMPTERRDTQIFAKKPSRGLEWIDAARKFLNEAVAAQMKCYVDSDEFEQEREALLAEYHYVDDNYIELPCATSVEKFLDASNGSCVLLTGESGSGKSWLLKHYSYRLSRECVVAAVFNDVEPRGRSLASALEMIVRTLRKCGRLNSEESVIDREDLIGWFESELGGLSQDKRVLIVLDSISASNMPDYKTATGKSIFQICLPDCAAIVVSAASYDDLRECDKKALEDTERTYLLPAMKPQDVVQRLYSALEKHGRCLYSQQQRNAVERCLRLSPSINTALDVYVLMRICAKLHSWDSFPFEGTINPNELMRFALFRQNRDDYRTLRSHTLGYLASSSVGLTEPEIIALLSSDDDVVNEIRDQTNKANARWKFEDTIPTVLWAMQYAELRTFLADVVVEGTTLLQLRHTRMRDAILAVLLEKERQKLLSNMRDYYRKKNWLLKGEDSIFPNRRKVQELLPLYQKLHDRDGLSQALRRPECVDAFVRSGARTEIKSYLEKFATNARSVRMLSILYEKELLFKLWPDSFVPAAFSELCTGWSDCGDAWKDEWLELLGKRCYVQGEAGHDGWAFFPQLNDNCKFALGPNELVAVLDKGTITILDLRRQEVLSASCQSVTEECFLYWINNNLIVRCKRRRLHYLYQNGQLIYSGEDNGVGSWDLLVENDDEKVRRGGGWMEAEHFGSATFDPLHESIVRYHLGDRMYLEEVFEPYDDALYAKVSGSLAAIVIDNKRLLVVELSKRIKLHEEVVRGLTDIEWSDTDCKLLVVVRGNMLRVISIDQRKPIGNMKGPQSSYLYHRMWIGAMRFAKSFNELIRQLAYLNPDAYTGREGAHSDIPLFGALSRKHGWAACYFYTKFGAYISVRDINTKQTLRINDVNAITYQDCTNDPFRVAPDQNGLILYSHGEACLYDLQLRTMMKVPASQAKTSPLDEVAESVRSTYVCFMVNAMYLPTEIKPPTGKKKRIGVFRKRKARKEEHEFIRSLIPYHRLLHADVLTFGDGYWLVDKDNGFYHAFNRAGKCLYRGMATGRILAADSDGRDGCLNLLMDTGRINYISLIIPG